MNFHLKKLLVLTNGIVLAISGCDTLRPLGIYFRPFANSVRDTIYHNNIVAHCNTLDDNLAFYYARGSHF